MEVVPLVMETLLQASDFFRLDIILRGEIPQHFELQASDFFRLDIIDAAKIKKRNAVAGL